MQVELKRVRVASLVFSGLPVVMLVIGVVAGLFTFILFPDPDVAARLSESYQRNVAAGVFALAYTLATVLFLVIIALLYNALTGFGLPGIKIDLASHETAEEE